jgi:hypothetical protein
MKLEVSIIILYTITIIVIGFLLYLALYKPSRVHRRSEIPHASFETHWWGYGWRPWWRKYNGLHGLSDGKPLPEPKMPVAPKPVIINTNPVLY